MKNRKTVVVAFLLCAVMLLGVGYAALSDTLDINGSADINSTAAEEAFNEDIYFSAAVANQGAPDTATIASNDPDMASFAANSLQGKDDFTTFTFTIKNAGDVDAIVTPTLAQDGNFNPDYFAVSSDWLGQPKELKAGQEITYTVTVTLLKTPTETIHGSFHIELKAVSVGGATTEETTVAP